MTDFCRPLNKWIRISCWLDPELQKTAGAPVPSALHSALPWSSLSEGTPQPPEQSGRPG